MYIEFSVQCLGSLAAKRNSGISGDEFWVTSSFRKNAILTRADGRCRGSAHLGV